MTTEIEKLWNNSLSDSKEKRINGDLMEQATYICSNCGHEMKRKDMQCVTCGATIDET